MHIFTQWIKVKYVWWYIVHMIVDSNKEEECLNNG